MNTRTIEPAGALPTYDVKDLVLFRPEDEPRDIVCRVVGYDREGEELRYRLKDPLYGTTYLATFEGLAPHIDEDLGFEDSFEAGIMDELDEYASSNYCE